MNDISQKNDAALMQGFPPAEEARVTLANWRKPPFNRWAFSHVREIVPAADIPNDPADVRKLPSAPVDLSPVAVDWEGERMGLEAVLKETGTDSLVVLHKGAVAYEYYTGETQPSTQHILMSVSKSVLGLLAGILVERGILDVSAPATKWVPEIGGTAYAGATIRDLLDMRAGVLFNEDYLATDGPIIEYRKAQGWEPVGADERASHLRGFYAAMTASDGPHSGRFHYVSPNTDLLGWVFERASGRRYADLVSDYLWRPMGAERDAYITVDRIGAPRCAGGICATTRDLARLGLLVAEGGKRDGRQIVPAAWIEDIMTAGDRAAWDEGDFAEDYPGLPIHYRSKWYVLNGDAPLVFGSGVFGQHVYIDPKNEMVIAQFSSHPLPTDRRRTALTLRAVEAIKRQLGA
jgi:CubicO group peptidase (beta-lactamase class C family)